MLNLGTPELVLIAVVALVVLGPSRLPDAARQAGKAVRELRRLSDGFQQEMRQAIQAPAPEPSTSSSRPRRTEPLRAA
jgi:Tat protein translocase TatB subunit